MQKCCIRPRPVWRGDVKACSGKGFGEKIETPSGDQQKVSKRGTVASRPGMLSKKELKQQAEAAEAAAAAAAASTEEDEDANPPTLEVPAVVNNRILSRIIIFSGIPVATAIALFPLFYYLKTAKGVDIPNEAVFFVQTIVFGGGLLGISYGALSASWNPGREGSFLGIDEFKQNFGTLMDKDKQR